LLRFVAEHTHDLRTIGNPRDRKVGVLTTTARQQRTSRYLHPVRYTLVPPPASDHCRTFVCLSWQHELKSSKAIRPTNLTLTAFNPRMLCGISAGDVQIWPTAVQYSSPDPGNWTHVIVTGTTSAHRISVIAYDLTLELPNVTITSDHPVAISDSEVTILLTDSNTVRASAGPAIGCANSSLELLSAASSGSLTASAAGPQHHRRGRRALRFGHGQERDLFSQQRRRGRDRGLRGVFAHSPGYRRWHIYNSNRCWSGGWGRDRFFVGRLT
jgi:hypothetical protein